MIRFLYYSIIALLLVACGSTATIQTGSYKYLYDYESRDLHPEFVVYHFSDDSSTVFFRIKSSELLYARNSSISPFTSKLNIRTIVSDESGLPADTTSIWVNDIAKSRQGWLLGSYNMALGQGVWNVLVEFTDINKNLTQPSYHLFDKSSSITSQNYLVKKFETGEPLFSGFVSPGQMIEVSSERNVKKSELRVMSLQSEVKLPPPPFSNSTPEIPGISSALESLISADDHGNYTFEVDKWNCFLTQDAFNRNGLLLKSADIFYPEIKNIDALEWPLRYITTKSEHEDIVKNTYPKKMIDNFWLECAGNKEHARELIKIYYSRVEEANYYFSTYTEGWRTDRGMIHLIFGNPTKIAKYAGTETWQYGDEGTPSMISFVFRKVESPLSQNVYVLDRDPSFKQHWERMVQTWRTGRIYNE